MDGSPSALREAPPAAPRHWCRFHTANFTYIVLSSSSFVDQLSSANAIDASVRRGDGEGGVRSENWAQTTSLSSKFLCTAYPSMSFFLPYLILGSSDRSHNDGSNKSFIEVLLLLKLEVLPTGTYQNRHRNWHRNFGPETPVHRSFRYYGRNGAFRK